MSAPRRVCVVGAGGREHALARALARTADVVVTPGNPGMPGQLPDGGGTITVTDAPPEDVDADLVVVGPEAPLVAGLADRLRSRGIPVFGPGADGARIEGSKAFMKSLLAESGVPTAEFGVFDDVAEAQAFLRRFPGPWVVKTDGLASGKGVLVTSSLAEADRDVEAKLSGDAFGDAGRRVVVEEYLAGPECSLLAICDGTRVVPLVPAQDFKRLADGGLGPNTGGMGSYSPMPGATPELVEEIMERAVRPLVGALVDRGIDYRGVLYAGLVLTERGPKVLEYNVRFGDPETQVVLPLLTCDVVELLTCAAAGRLDEAPVPETADAAEAAEAAAVCVVLAAPGYPAAPQTGGTIGGLGPDGQLAEPAEAVTVLHAGTARPDPDGPFRVAGGRVLGVTALAPDLSQARDRAYEALSRITMEGAQFRTDIAAEAAKAAAGAAAPAAAAAAVSSVGAP